MVDCYTEKNPLLYTLTTRFDVILVRFQTMSQLQINKVVETLSQSPYFPKPTPPYHIKFDMGEGVKDTSAKPAHRKGEGR